jgi:hypothetical protein
MRKEQIIAVVLGSLIGVVVAFGIWRFVKGKPQSQSPENTQVQENKTASVDELSIVSPTDSTVSRNSNLTIAGFAPPNSVVSSNASQSSIVLVDPSGEFEIKAELAAGINRLKVWSFEKDGLVQEKELVVVYSTQLEGDETGGSIAVLGTVTDISSDSLQIRTSSGEIEQLLLADDATLARMVESSTDEIDISDLAIGDFIAALGIQDNDVAKIERIIVTTQNQEEETLAISGTIETLSSSEFFAKTPDGQQVSIDATGSPNIYSARDGAVVKIRLSTAKPGDPIVVIGSMEEELIATTVILL